MALSICPMCDSSVAPRSRSACLPSQLADTAEVPDGALSPIQDANSIKSAQVHDNDADESPMHLNQRVLDASLQPHEESMKGS